MASLKYWQAVNSALREEMTADPSVVIFGEDVGKAGGAFGATRGLQRDFGATRVRDTPLAEGAMTGVAVGAAMTGLRPVVEIMFFDFITLAMDQLVNQAAKIRYMSGGMLSVPMTLITLCGSARGSGPQHSQTLESWLACVPGLVVVYPSNAADAKGLLKTAIRSDDPVIFIESSALWTRPTDVPDGEHLVPFGSARVARPGNDVTIVAWGWAASRCEEAGDLLEAQGVSAEVIDLRSINPLDTTTIVESVARTGRLVIVHDAPQAFGPGGEIGAIIAEQTHGLLHAPPLRITPPFAPVPFPKHLEQAYYPPPQEIARRVIEALTH